MYIITYYTQFDNAINNNMSNMQQNSFGIIGQSKKQCANSHLLSKDHDSSRSALYTTKSNNLSKKYPFYQSFKSDRIVQKGSICQILTHISDIIRLSKDDCPAVIDVKYGWCILLDPILKKLFSFFIFLREDLCTTKEGYLCCIKMFRRSTKRPGNNYIKFGDVGFDNITFLVEFLCKTLLWKLDLHYFYNDKDLTNMVESIFLKLTKALTRRDSKDWLNFDICNKMAKIYNNAGMEIPNPVTLDAKKLRIELFPTIDTDYLQKLRILHNKVKSNNVVLTTNIPFLKRKLDNEKVIDNRPHKIRKIVTVTAPAVMQYMETPMARIINISNNKVVNSSICPDNEALIIIPDGCILLGTKLIVRNDNFSSDSNKEILVSASILINGRPLPEHSYIEIPKDSILVGNSIYKKDSLNNRYVPL